METQERERYLWFGTSLYFFSSAFLILTGSLNSASSEDKDLHRMYLVPIFFTELWYSHC